MIKEDGSVAIHNDKGYKPINYMIPPVESTINDNIWRFDSKNETIVLEFERIYMNTEMPMEEDAVKVIKEGTEAHLQEWLAEHLSEIAPELQFLEREFETGEGPVDIRAKNLEGETVLVEVKRTAGGPAVSQIKRYLSAFSETGEIAKGVLMALDFNPRALTLAEKHGIDCYIVPKELYPHGLKTIEEARELPFVRNFSKRISLF